MKTKKTCINNDGNYFDPNIQPNFNFEPDFSDCDADDILFETMSKQMSENEGPILSYVSSDIPQMNSKEKIANAKHVKGQNDRPKFQFMKTDIGYIRTGFDDDAAFYAYTEYLMETQRREKLESYRLIYGKPTLPVRIKHFFRDNLADEIIDSMESMKSFVTINKKIANSKHAKKEVKMGTFAMPKFSFIKQSRVHVTALFDKVAAGCKTFARTKMFKPLLGKNKTHKCYVNGQIRKMAPKKMIVTGAVLPQPPKLKRGPLIAIMNSNTKNLRTYNNTQSHASKPLTITPRRFYKAS